MSEPCEMFESARNFPLSVLNYSCVDWSTDCTCWCYLTTWKGKKIIWTGKKSGTKYALNKNVDHGLESENEETRCTRYCILFTSVFERHAVQILRELNSSVLVRLQPIAIAYLHCYAHVPCFSFRCPKSKRSPLRFPWSQGKPCTSLQVNVYRNFIAPPSAFVGCAWPPRRFEGGNVRPLGTRLLHNGVGRISGTEIRTSGPGLEIDPWDSSTLLICGNKELWENETWS